MATTTVTKTLGTLKLAGAAPQMRKMAEPNIDRLTHACVVADDLITQLNHLNDSLLIALERLRTENTDLHDREKCLDAEVRTVTKSMRWWRTLVLIVFSVLFFLIATPYALEFALDHGAEEHARRALDWVREEEHVRRGLEWVNEQEHVRRALDWVSEQEQVHRGLDLVRQSDWIHKLDWVRELDWVHDLRLA